MFGRRLIHLATVDQLILRVAESAAKRRAAGNPRDTIGCADRNIGGGIGKGPVFRVRRSSTASLAKREQPLSARKHHPLVHLKTKDIL